MMFSPRLTIMAGIHLQGLSSVALDKANRIDGTQVKGAEKIFFGLDDVKDCTEIIIVEGEMDKLAMNEAGIWNVISVPDGAPSQASASKPLPPSNQDQKFSYLWNCRYAFSLIGMDAGCACSVIVSLLFSWCFTLLI